MQTALFHNFTDESFTGYWNGKAKTFKAGEKQYMPAYLAQHYAKHLTNRELHKKGMENYTSPKNPAQVPQFMELFSKACIIEDDKEQDEAELQTDLANRGEPSMNINVQQPKPIDPYDAKATPVTGPSGPATVIAPPDADDDENFEDADDSNKKE